MSNTKRPKSARRLTTYTRLKSDTSKFYKFTNKRTKNLRPQDKSIITKKSRELSPHIKAVKEGRAQFVQLSPEKLRAVKRTGQYVTTNKGFFVYGTGIKNITVKINKQKHRKVAGITVKKEQRKEVYYSVKPSFDHVNDLIEWLFKTLKNPPNSVRIAVNQFSTSWAKAKNAWFAYATEFRSIDEDITDQGHDSPFRGAFAIWYL